MRRFNRVEHVGKIVRPSSPILPIAENSGENFRRAAIARREMHAICRHAFRLLQCQDA
jgi:hypothetical protein